MTDKCPRVEFYRSCDSRWACRASRGTAIMISNEGDCAHMSSVINVTHTAATKINALLSEENKQQAGLRVFVQGGGCSGFQYGLMIEEGEGDGEFRFPAGVAVASDGSVYVSDPYNNRIQKFTSEGVFVSKWGTRGTGDGEFWSPEGISVASDGSVYVADTNNNRIQKFSVGP